MAFLIEENRLTSPSRAPVRAVIADGGNGHSAARAEGTRRAKVTFQETVADDYDLPNKPGALARSLDGLAAKGVNLSSICTTVSKCGRKAVVILAGAFKAKACSR
jgi:hypothetical protein